MSYFITGLLLLANVCFWGAGLAMLATPRRYRRFAAVFAPVAGLSLQSLVVWAGAWLNLPGTDSYARWSLVLPAVLLALAWWRGRGASAGWTRLGGLWVMLVLQLSLLLLPFAVSGHGLTTASMGSLDAADYGAGARVFKEFAHADRTGFLGQTEVVSVGAVDNFYDFWLRTNHFSPSALIALNGSILGLAPHQLTSLLTVVALVCVLPLVFWLARSGFRYGRGLSLAITAIYAVNPINWYAVYNVAPAQILAANAIALVTWCGLAAWRNQHTPRGGLGTWCGLLAVGYGLIFGAYNFIIVACLAPCVAWAGASALLQRRPGAVVRWLWVMLVPLGVMAVVYATRSLGVVERFLLFKAGFGWDIPVLTPEGWFGMVEGSWLRPHAGPVRLLLLALALAVVFVPFARGLRGRGRGVLLAICVLFPIAAGYTILQVRQQQVGNNASYDAYKLLSVFHPVALCALCCGLHVALGAGRGWRVAAATAACLVFAVNLAGEWRVFYRMASPRFVVEERLVGLSVLESDAAVKSVNLRISDGWSKLWANVQLLRTPQYFDIHTYEGRKAVGLRGDWDLNGPFFVLVSAAPAEQRRPTDRFAIIKRSSPAFMETAMGEGWSDFRGGVNGGPWWMCWSGGERAALRLINPQSHPLRVSLATTFRTTVPRTCEVVVGGEVLGRVRLENGPVPWRTEGLLLPPGETLVEFCTPEPAVESGGRVRRTLTLGLEGCVIEAAPGAAQ